ncbi:hypothetical protein HIM_05613 [Hirsutella minnesotensis 3608]|uniref:Uncharacterized protein n=1 Tax=Hirsutella minnesotensis 3608 TaxID=1043627 RepID=A0A0F8A076_9HYPO|nr:hypothetical protein HIM_05613 [Hirsutella minnesotensis 3608]
MLDTDTIDGDLTDIPEDVAYMPKWSIETLAAPRPKHHDRLVAAQGPRHGGALHAAHGALLPIFEVAPKRRQLLKAFGNWVACRCKATCDVEWNFE